LFEDGQKYGRKVPVQGRLEEKQSKIFFYRRFATDSSRFKFIAHLLYRSYTQYEQLRDDSYLTLPDNMSFCNFQ